MKVKSKYSATITLNAHEVAELHKFIGRLELGLSLRDFIDRTFNDMGEPIFILRNLANKLLLADQLDSRNGRCE